jgi:hypothetical protein
MTWSGKAAWNRSHTGAIIACAALLFLIVELLRLFFGAVFSPLVIIVSAITV